MNKIISLISLLLIVLIAGPIRVYIEGPERLSLYTAVVYFLLPTCLLFPLILPGIMYLLFTSQRHRQKHDKVRTLCFLGSGGHTTEMIYLVKSLYGTNTTNTTTTNSSSSTSKTPNSNSNNNNSNNNNNERDNIRKERYKDWLWLIGDTDHTSLNKVKAEGLDTSQHLYIPRAREVGQSYITSIYTTLYTLYQLIYIIYQYKPSFILLNGPGTCVPICYICKVYEYILGYDMCVVYVESYCRVCHLSLTGKLLYHVVDHFIVQWKQLLIQYPKAIYLGRIT